MMVTKNQHIRLVVKKLQYEVLEYWSIVFERPVGFVFKAGDWIDLEFKDGPLNGGKTYSLSSSPTEAGIVITFRKGLSEIKRTLQSVKPGDEMYISQYGNDYDFQLHQNRSSVLIAGGVGIAPFRGMLKEMLDTHSKNDVSLIYINQQQTFLFEDEINNWAAASSHLTVTYINTKDINRKRREGLIRSLIKDVSQNFYISGPPGMAESHEHLLIDMGVPVRTIRIDSFGGY